MVSENSESHILLLAQIGRTTLAAGSIDASLLIILAALLADVPSAGFSRQLASIYIYSARSVDQRVEIVNKTFSHVFQSDLSLPKNDNRKRSVEFLLKCKNNIISSILAKRWIRNLAAHGMINLAGDEALLIPSVWDIEATAPFKRKNPDSDGLNRNQIDKLTKQLIDQSNLLAQVGMAVKDYRQLFHAAPHIFLETVNRLAQDMNITPLRLQDLSAGPPLRQSRTKSPKRSDNAQGG